MHMRRRSAKIVQQSDSDKAVISFINDSRRKQRWASLKAEASEHKFCISMTSYLAGFIALSQVLLLVWPVAGAMATVAALVGFTVLAMHSRKARPVAIAASILPVATMASLALPQQSVPAQAGVLYATVLFLTIAYRITMPENRAADISWRAVVSWLPLAVAGGTAAGALGYSMLGNELSFDGAWPAAAALLTGFAIVEELYFRGFLQRLTRKAVGPFLAIALSVTAYTALTLPFGSIAITAFAMLASTTLSVLYYARPSLVLGSAANVAMKLTFITLLT
jgi:membrane protease YdiL (CAAX protease family)